MKRTWLEISLGKLRNNLEVARNLSKGKEIIGVVKANAYGCGAPQIANALSKMGVKIFGVACLDEAITLRKSGITEEILILGPTPREAFGEAFERDIQLSISTYDDLLYIEESRFPRARVHLNLDTGMGRLGFLDTEIMDILNLTSFNHVKIIGLFSHFSCADDEKEDGYTFWQINKFNQFLSLHPDVNSLKYIHLQNSAGIMRFHQYTPYNTARAGIMLYGYSDLNSDLIPITSLKTKISHLKVVKEDSYISYGREGFAKAGTMVATLPIGYADGYSRRFSSKGKMYIDGVPCKVLGKVCMDMTMIEIPESIRDSVKVGKVVEVLGRDMYEQMKEANISPYEMLTAITPRVEIVYVD